MGRKTRTVTIVALSVAGAVVMAGCRPATPPRDPFRAADFTFNKVADQQFAGFTVTGNVSGNKDLEIVTTSLNINYVPPVNGVAQRPTIVPGSVTLHQGSGASWTSTKVFDTDQGLFFPNKPTITDVDGDGKNDIVVPSGNFFSRVDPVLTGAMTWWKNNGDGSFTRNNIATNVKGSYHSAIHVDFDGDGVKDIVTNFEDGGWPSYPFGIPPFVPQSSRAPITKVQYFPGLGGGTFGAAVDLANGGGSLPTVVDMDLDGDLDVASAQYFGTKSAPIVIPPNPGNPDGVNINDESFVWFENTAGKNAGALTSANFTKNVIARGLGESFEILPVDNMDGDGKYGAIGINHVNPAVPGTLAAPQVVRLTPGADIRQPWTVERIDSGFTVDDLANGQAAPGFASDGDVDGDGDVDIVLSGDSDGTIYWLERKADGSWAQRDVITEFGRADMLTQLATPENKYGPNARPYGPNAGYGQGSVSVADLNRDGKNEIVFSSFNAAVVEVASRDANTGGLVPTVPRVPDLFKRY